jgi:hypothetical protein
MRHTIPVPRTARGFAPLLSLVSVWLLFSAQARAQDPFANEGAADDGKQTDAPKPAPAKGASSATGVPEPEAGRVVEQLPGSAFPEWRTRGLYGGSLWLTFHGMPWPYQPRTGIGISGYAWVDTGYENIARGTMSTNEAHEVNYLLQQGRAVLRVTPAYFSGGWFVQSQVELVGNKDQTVTQTSGVVDVDDLWVRTGYWKKWDVMFGRFEGFEVYHFGMGLDLNTLERQGATDDIKPPPDVHGVRWGFVRPPGVGNAALHVYPLEILRFELLGQVGNEGGLNSLGVRPAVVLDLGTIKVKAAGHYHRQFAVPDTSREARKAFGGTGAIQFVFDPIVELGVNADYGYVDHYSPTSAMGGSMGDYDPRGSWTNLSFGGFANFRVISDVLLGVGANYSTREDALESAPGSGVFGKYSHLQAFGAVQYLIRKQLFVKVVGGYARAHFEPVDITPAWDNSMVSGRIRLLYLF